VQFHDRRTGTVHELSHSDVKQAHGWVNDSFEDAPEDMTDHEAVSGVHRHYEGGIHQFLKDGNPGD
jgi:hypothetical protein